MSSSEDYLDQLLNGMTSDDNKTSSSGPDLGAEQGAFSDDLFSDDPFGSSDDDILKDFESEIASGSDDFLSDFEKELGSVSEEPLSEESLGEEDDSLFFRDLDDLINKSRAEADDSIESMTPTSQRASDENFNLTDGGTGGMSAPDSLPEDILNLLEPTEAESVSEEQPDAPAEEEPEGDAPREEQLSASADDLMEHSIDEYELGEEIDKSELDNPEHKKKGESVEEGTEDLIEEETEIPDTEAIAAAAAAGSGLIDESAASEEGGEDELLDLLNGLDDGDASDIGELLNQDASGVQELTEEEIEKLQGELSEGDSEEEREKLEGKFHTGKKRKKEKRKTGNRGGKGDDGEKKGKGLGFFAKLLALLFGSEDDLGESNMIQAPPDEKGPVDENLAILEELDAAGEVEPGGAPAGKKKKEKKEKKEKPKKEKPKKEPKPKKPPKPKKEKKPREKDTSPPLPRGPVIVVALFAISLLALILLATKLFGSAGSVSEARTAYEQGDYVAAFIELSGMDLSGDDAELKEKAGILASIQKPYQDADVLYDLGEYEMSLDSLVRALGRCYNYEERAAEIGLTDTIATLRDQITEKLLSMFQVSADEAREIYSADDREDYSILIHQVIKGLGLEKPEA